jgi:hypothetical protein
MRSPVAKHHAWLPVFYDSATVTALVVRLNPSSRDQPLITTGGGDRPSNPLSVARGGNFNQCLSYWNHFCRRTEIR